MPSRKSYRVVRALPRYPTKENGWAGYEASPIPPTIKQLDCEHEDYVFIQINNAPQNRPIGILCTDCDMSWHPINGYESEL